VQKISSILDPGPFELDFRPLICLLLVMIFSLLVVVIKNRKHFKRDFESEWEL